MRSFDLFITWFWQRKRKWAVVSGSEPQLHIGFKVSRKLCLNLCSLRWLKFSPKRVSNLMPLSSWIAKTEFSEILTKLSNAFLNDIGEVNDFVSSLKLFHSWEQRGKNIIKVNCSWGSLFYNILCCGCGLVDWIVVELKYIH